NAKTEELSDLIDWLRGELARTDASLLEEWQRLNNPESLLVDHEKSPPEAPDITRDVRSFTVLLRNSVWRVVQRLARQDYAGAAELLVNASAGERSWPEARLREQLEPCFEEYTELRTDPAARSPRYLVVQKGDAQWNLTQSLVDPNEDLGWQLDFEVDLNASREENRPVLRLTTIARG